MSRPSLMVISHACLESVNRAVYRELAVRHGVSVHLVIPAFNDVGDGYRAATPISGEPFQHSILMPMGRHLRLRRLRGLGALIKSLRPSHILVDSDPATWLVNETLFHANQVQAKVWSLTCENLPRNYFAEGTVALSRGRPWETLSSWLTALFAAGARRGLSQLFTISRDGTAVMERLGYSGRVRQIPLGFDGNLFRIQSAAQRESTRARLNLQQTTIAYFGRLSPEKGIHVLISALAKLRHHRWQLLLDHFTHQASPYIEGLKQQLASCELSDRVVFFEAKHSEMPAYMNAADIVVLPSVSQPKWKEQYGRVVPEAMACGRVVVGSLTGTIPELLGEPQLLFPEGDANALARLLEKLILLPLEDRLAIGAKLERRARAKLALDTQAAIWAECLGSSPNKAVDKVSQSQ